MILFPQTLPFCIFVTHCRFCKDCFIIFVCHLPYSIWYLARIFASILSDINKIQPVHRLSGSPFASLMCWKIILLCSRQLEESGIVIANQCVRSLSAPSPRLYPVMFLWSDGKEPSCIRQKRAQVISFFFPLSATSFWSSVPTVCTFRTRGSLLVKFLGFMTPVSVVLK